MTWVLDANSKHEVSSKEHLIQLMNNGILYTNAGSVPTNFFSSDYIQTAKIDLGGDSAGIIPIGGSTGFSCEYDGKGFTVSNWFYVDPNIGNGSSIPSVGFFSYINVATAINIRIAGACTLGRFQARAGVFAGHVNNSTAYNIEVDLSPGSYINQGDDPTGTTQVGPVAGWIYGGAVMAVTFRGQIDSMVTSVNAPTTYADGFSR